MTTITDTLLSMRDEGNARFVSGMIPNIAADTIIGIRTPALRAYAKQLTRSGDTEAFLHDLPHRLFDENQLHAFLIAEIKDFDLCLTEVGRFLPYVDNWATCDQLSPRCFARHREKLLPWVEQWIGSEHDYTVRFGLGMLMQHYLDDAFRPRYLRLAASVRREEYYVRMMQAWYFATALAKQYDAALPYLQKQRLDRWVHNKTIQKAVESYRIADEQKTYLRTLRIK